MSSALHGNDVATPESKAQDGGSSTPERLVCSLIVASSFRPSRLACNYPRQNDQTFKYILVPSEVIRSIDLFLPPFVSGTTDVMMGSAGRGFRGRGGGPGGFRGRGGGGGRFGGRGMGGMDNRPAEPSGPRDPRNLVSYIDVDAPKVSVIYRIRHRRCGKRGRFSNVYILAGSIPDGRKDLPLLQH